MMHFKLKIDEQTYIVKGNARKILDFIGAFYDNEIKIEKVAEKYVYLSDSDASKLSQKAIKSIKDFCKDNKIDDFQSYQELEPAKIGMSSTDIKHIKPVQRDLQSLIHGLLNQSKPTKAI